MSHRLVSALLIITIILSGLIITDSSEAQDGCPHAPTQLAVGQRAVTNDPLNVRSAPGANNTKIGQITLNKLVEIIGGPVCEGGWRWWQVIGPNMENNTQVSGWVVEVGQGNVYLLLPEGTPLGAHNRWDGPDTIPPTNDQPLMEVVPGIFRGQEDSIRPVATTGVCQNYPYVGMKFLWNNFGMPMIGVRVWPTAQAALMDIDAGWITVNGQNIEMAGLIDGLGWLYPEVILHVEATHFYLIHAGPVCDDDQCAWEISLPDGTTGWVVWRDDFCEWRYGSPLWQIGDVLTVDASPFREIPIFYGDPVPETPTGSLPNGTSVRIIGEGINMPEWYAPWVGAFSIIAYGPEDLGYRWWPVQLEDGTQGYVPEGLPFVKPWMRKSSVYAQFIGADLPWSITYIYVPAPVAMDAIAVHHEPNEASRTLGYLKPMQYYSYTLDPQIPRWLQITNPFGESGWIDLHQASNLIRVGNLHQSDLSDPQIDEIITQSTVATLTTLDKIEAEQLDMLEEALHREQLQIAVSLSEVAVFVVENVIEGEDIRNTDLICIPNTVLGLVASNPTSDRVEMICTIWGVITKQPLAFATITANPDIYIDSWYLPLQTRFLDRVSGACLFAELFLDGGGGSYCEGKNEFDFFN